MRLQDDARAGRVTVLLVMAASKTSEATAWLGAFAGLAEAFGDAGVQLLALSADSAGLAMQSKLGFPLLCDPELATGKALGLRAPGLLAPIGDGAAERLVVVLDESGRIETLITPGLGESEAASALAYCVQRAAASKPSVVTSQPPVLIVPRLIPRSHCSRMIECWEAGRRYSGGVADGKGERHQVARDVKVREDVALGDLDAEAQELFALFRSRLFPEVRKAFGFHISRAETLRLGCYDARDGALFKAHRDDTAPAVRHRRFAMSLFLNSGAYEGGHLRFPEYGPQLYDPPAGSAVVFSCSLLHEVLPLVAGRRFALLGFFHGEVEEAERRARKEPYEYLLVDHPAKLYGAAPAPQERFQRNRSQGSAQRG